ncbi:hypothetical protein AB0M35_28815 [Micromonospora sp. NPDC051196]|uniref:hypothetical protein n=1 Tax=Micromonospora sp. NPDC051196 TaxID=3155281 RepID=UPI00343CC557
MAGMTCGRRGHLDLPQLDRYNRCHRGESVTLPGSRLVLVRHAMPVVEPAVPAERWRLGPAGRAAARSYLKGACLQGWEAQDQVVHRFDEAVIRHAAAAAGLGRTLVVGTHGMALTMWLASRDLLGPDPIPFWATLRFPPTSSRSTCYTASSGASGD